MTSDTVPRIVLKFGGTSVSSRKGWDTIAGLVEERLALGHRILIVHSALAGITDMLERLPDEALEGRHSSLLDRLTERHFDLCGQLELDGPTLLGEELAELRKAAEGVALLEEFTPRVRARILAFGESLSTRMGAAFLVSMGHPVEWLDAGTLLRAVVTDRQSGSAIWLSAECDPDLEPAVRDRLDALSGVGLTQGFTARTEPGEPVVLGRGGSDTAAAYLAGKWGADRLEIWSDVPGMFSADPRLVPSARLLKRLNYHEAQEITTTGSGVVHPRAIRALRDSGIPIHLKSTMDLGSPSTVIEPNGTTGAPQVKAISWKGKVVLVSMETLGMWHEIGFLARAFAVFKEQGISVDLVSTSETNVTVSARLEGDAPGQGEARGRKGGPLPVLPGAGHPAVHSRQPGREPDPGAAPPDGARDGGVRRTPDPSREPGGERPELHRRRGRGGNGSARAPAPRPAHSPVGGVGGVRSVLGGAVEGGSGIAVSRERRVPRLSAIRYGAAQSAGIRFRFRAIQLNESAAIAKNTAASPHSPKMSFPVPKSAE